MQYSAICIKAYGDRSYPEYYPQIDAKGHFIPEPGDNAAVSVDFTNLQIKQNSEALFETEHGLDGKLYITDARIIVMCDDYESGQVLWIGNPLITAIAGVASSAAAKSRSAGKVLTGHIRFEWLVDTVALSEKILFNLYDETLIINYQDPFDAMCSLTVSLKNEKGLAHRIDAEIRKRLARRNQKQLDAQPKPELPEAGSTKTHDHAYCTQCGKRISRSHLYCKHCGAKQ